MTIINCSSNCIYQKDGKCNFENILEKKYTQTKELNINCTYFAKK